jgi:hypothetical protein
MNDIDKAYRSIGEFAVAFQWIENKYREIGWFILDPERKGWPPMQLRAESNKDLINTVTDLYLNLASKYQFPNGPAQSADFARLRNVFHALRRFRNRLLHSVFIEFKSGGELIGLLRSNPQVMVDTETGEVIFDQEPFTEAVIHEKLEEIAGAAWRLNTHFMQLVHWFPFHRFPASL